MSDTPASLLERLRLEPDQASWRRLVDLYQPMLTAWLRRYALQAADLDDLRQDILSVVFREVSAFQHQGQRGAFRCWLRRIMVNRLRTFWREQRKRSELGDGRALAELIEQLDDPASGLSRLWDSEHDRYVTRRLTELLKGEFEPATWNAFEQLIFEGRSTADVARTLNMTANAVRLAKSRVLRRLRQEIQGLLD
ncbi:MAG TPA: RNA polymerase sigma factor [Pirellulales bacterium]